MGQITALSGFSFNVLLMFRIIAIGQALVLIEINHLNAAYHHPMG